MTTESMGSAFVEPKAIFADPDVRAMMVHDCQCNTVKRRLSVLGRQRRVYCFWSPPTAS